jgi:hypothetical protein
MSANREKKKFLVKKERRASKINSIIYGKIFTLHSEPLLTFAAALVFRNHFQHNSEIIYLSCAASIKTTLIETRKQTLAVNVNPFSISF